MAMKKESFYPDPNDIQEPDGKLDFKKILLGGSLRSCFNLDFIRRGKNRIVPRKRNLSEIDGDFE